MPRRPIGRRPKHPFRRPLRGPRGRRGIPGMDPRRPAGAIPPMLVKANQLMKAGKFVEAALAFSDLAKHGTERGHERAPVLYFQAARCYFLAEMIDEALTILRKASQYFASEERWRELYRGLNKSANYLEQNKYVSEAHLVNSWIVEIIPTMILEKLKSAQKDIEVKHQDVQLPTTCPSCGGVVDPREAEWVDDSSVACEFCGSIVRGE